MSEWYFMSGGEQQGPVTAAQLKGLASTGTLKPDDLVWNQTMTEWVAARRVKGLPFAGQPAATKTAVASSATATIRRAPAAVAAREPESTPEPMPSRAPDTFEPPENGDHPVSSPSRKMESIRTADEEPTSEAAELLGQTRSWVGLMSFVFFIAIGLTIAYEVWVVLPVAKGANTKHLLAQAQTPWGMRQIVRAVAALLMLIPWLSLLRCGSALGRAKSNRGSADVDHAIKAQKSFWKTMAVTSILVIVIGVSAYLYKMVLKK